MADFLWQDGQTVLLTGDSITDCGRRDPNNSPYGGGYVRQIIDLVTARYPERQIRWVNTGISGHCVDDLQGRWQADVLDHQPSWVTIMIGINDLHRTLNQVKELPPREYEPRYRAILDQCRAAGHRLVLIEPFYMSLQHGQDNLEAEVLHRLEGYLEVVARLAVDYQAVHVKTQEAWLRVLRHFPPAHWCGEPVHPNAHGHLVIANAVLQAVGF
ncbi:MAG: SGNH/GDSL hydrolase family protein [Fimbriimonadaceae bacterium]|nr:SGNH/GDSL hydrolase family protein [Fimbriimonadaceae bacterium]